MAKVSDFDYSAELMGDYLKATISPNIIQLISASTLMRILRLTSPGAGRGHEPADKPLLPLSLGAVCCMDMKMTLSSAQMFTKNPYYIIKIEKKAHLLFCGMNIMRGFVDTYM